jgi:hypothetical protein
MSRQGDNMHVMILASERGGIIPGRISFSKTSRGFVPSTRLPKTKNAIFKVYLGSSSSL